MTGEVVHMEAAYIYIYAYIIYSTYIDMQYSQYKREIEREREKLQIIPRMAG